MYVAALISRLRQNLSLRCTQRQLGPMIPFEQLGREPSGSILGPPQLQFAGPRAYCPTVVARSIALPPRRALALLGAHSPQPRSSPLRAPPAAPCAPAPA